MQKLKVNDEVIVIAGKNKGKKGKISKINWKKNSVLLNGINMVKKAVRPTQTNPNGGLMDKEAPIHISNVALISPKTGKGTRIRIERKDGKNVRIAVACKTQLDKEKK